MPQLLGLIFDLEGTLIDNATDVRRTLNTVLAAHQRRSLSQSEIKNMIGDGLEPLLHRAFTATGLPMAEQDEQAVFREFLGLYRSQKASPEELYSETRETLTAFRAIQVKIGLCTNKPYLPTIKLLKDIDIIELFDFVAGHDTFSVCKPNPGHVLGVAKGLGVPTQNCVMIGDSPNDIIAAKGAGVAGIAISHGHSDNSNALGADAVISEFTELPQALRRLGFDFLS